MARSLGVSATREPRHRRSSRTRNLKVGAARQSIGSFSRSFFNGDFGHRRRPIEESCCGACTSMWSGCRHRRRRSITLLADQSADAYEKVVDRLLASPQYGERWARHWMDVVHYADSHGFEHDMPRSMWPYRDYLINAFNSDMPYRQFLREQVAGTRWRRMTRGC